MTPAPNDWISFGTHRVRLEPPDHAHVVWNGDVTPEHVHAVFDAIESLGQPRIYVVNDLTRSGTPNEQVRRTMVKEKRMRLLYAMACIGASYPIQTLMNLALRATAFFAGGKMVKVTFVKDEAKARAWLAAERARAGGPKRADSSDKP
jgi:hypothetical protein